MLTNSTGFNLGYALGSGKIGNEAQTSININDSSTFGQNGSFSFGLNGSNFGSGWSTVGGALSSLSSAIPSGNGDHNENNVISKSMRDSASKFLLQSGNPWMMAAGATVKLVDATGGFTDATKGLGSLNDTANFVASLALPGAGWFVSGLPKYEKSLELASSSGYTGTSATGDKIAQLSGTKALFGRSRAKRKIRDLQLRDNTVVSNIYTGQDRYLLGQTMASQNADAYTMKLTGGYQDTTRVAKHGMKIKDSTFKFKDGGSFNIIPAGALHARLHHMETGGGITKKGIPVVDDDGVQHAEIEKNEIIFRKEVTDLLEQLAKENTDDSAIQAGKLLVEEIFNNTKDYTGLIEETEAFKQGGVIKAGFGWTTAISAAVDTIKNAQKAKKTFDENQLKELEKRAEQELAARLNQALEYMTSYINMSNNRIILPQKESDTELASKIEVPITNSEFNTITDARFNLDGGELNIIPKKNLILGSEGNTEKPNEAELQKVQENIEKINKELLSAADTLGGDINDTEREAKERLIALGDDEIENLILYYQDLWQLGKISLGLFRKFLDSIDFLSEKVHNRYQ